MVRLMVVTNYRQSSLETNQLRDIDPENRLIARQSSFRLDAEFIRDNALSVNSLYLIKLED